MFNERENNEISINRQWNDVTYNNCKELVMIVLDGSDFQRQASQIFLSYGILKNMKEKREYLWELWVSRRYIYIGEICVKNEDVYSKSCDRIEDIYRIFW